MQQLQKTDQGLKHLSGKLRRLANSLELSSDEASSLISQAKELLVSSQVELIRQEATSLGILDFYPTPSSVIEKMLSLASIKPGMRVLEPSAGIGHICREIRKAGVEPDCFEISPLLTQGLVLQGFNVVGGDFLSSTPTAIYDCIVANPPFSSNGVARHTLYALDWVRPGGRLVTVAHHYLLKPSATDRAFFQWLKGFGAHFYNCGQAFFQSDRPTNVPIQLIVLNKPCWMRREVKDDRLNQL